MVGGNHQIYGVNYFDVFTPVTLNPTHQIILVIGVQHGYEIHMIHFKSEYLNRTIKEDIYIHAPPGYLKKDQEGMVMKSHKGLYGLKQAGLAWYEDLKYTMVSKLGFTCCSVDRGVFYKHNNEGCIIR